ncbi:MAG TPA: LPS export ABC transporter periplasmic protein LptC [Moraxellaceae bacterium]|nr:LPS export ABC transporter periplasmic protein LptC [Moraxellaceae bacterium]
MDARNLLSLSGVLLVIGAAGYYWGIAQRAPGVLAEPEARRPEYVVNGIRSIETDAGGRLLRHVTARELRHYDAPRDVSEIEAPVATFYDNGREAWRIRAERGTGLDQNTEVRLEGGVVAERRDAALPVTLATASLTAWPKQERLLTRERVTVTTPRGQLQSRGLEASLRRSELTLTQDVSATYAPAPR